MYSFTILLTFLFILHASAFPAPDGEIFKTLQPVILASPRINDGGEIAFGNITFPTVEIGYQASGILTEGCDNEDAASHIEKCYGVYLAQNPTLMLDPGAPLLTPKQRTEFLYPYAFDGDKKNYEWSSWISSETGSTENFFHMFQLFSHGDNGPIISLDLYNGTAKISDTVRECGSMCTRIPLSRFMDRTIRHEITVTYGSDGNFVYTARLKETGDILMQYNAPGYMGSDRQTIKAGLYRRVFPDQTLARGYFGDFVTY